MVPTVGFQIKEKELLYKRYREESEAAKTVYCLFLHSLIVLLVCRNNKKLYLLLLT